MIIEDNMEKEAPASEFNSTDIFARVKDNKVIEYPVSYQAIINRCHPFSFYIKVEFDDKPITPPFHQVVEKTEVLKDGRVLVRYSEPKPVSLESLLRLVNIETRPGIPNNQSIFSDDLRDRIFQLIEERIDQKLDSLVSEKGYKNVESAISYEFSTHEPFSKDAVVVRELRDRIWIAFIDYKNHVFNKEIPFPTSWSEIEEKLPLISWPSDTSKVS